MEINKVVLKTLVVFLIVNLVITPGMVTMAFAQATPQAQAASDDEVQEIQQLANTGYLGDKKDYYLALKNLTEDDITDAILKARDFVMAADLKNLQNGSFSYQVSDLQSFLDLVKDKEEDIRARKASAWKLENRLQKMIAVLLVVPAGSQTPSINSTAVPNAPTTTVIPSPPTATPIPGPSRDEFNGLKDSFKKLDGKLSDMQSDLDKKSETIEALQKNGQDIQTSNADIQEQLQLIKKLVDRVQDDLKKSEDRMDDIEKKVDQKMITDTDMQQEMTIMHKDLRDDTEDISVLKQEEAKLDKTDYGPRNPLDDFLNSKWLPGGALIVGLAALTISLVRK